MLLAVPAAHEAFFFVILFSQAVMTSPGLCNHRDTHQLQKSRCFCNEETHNGRRCSGLPLAVTVAPEGICAQSGGASAGEQTFLII